MSGNQNMKQNLAMLLVASHETRTFKDTILSTFLNFLHKHESRAKPQASRNTLRRGRVLHTYPLIGLFNPFLSFQRTLHHIPIKLLPLLHSS